MELVAGATGVSAWPVVTPQETSMKDEQEQFEDIFADESEVQSEETETETAEVKAEEPTEAKAEQVEAKDDATPEPEAETPTEGDEPEPADPTGAAFKKTRETAYEKGKAEALKEVETNNAAFMERIAKLEGQLQQVNQQQIQRAQPAPEPIKEEIPDSLLEPERFAQWQENRIQQTISDGIFKNNMNAAYSRELQAGKTDADLRQEAVAFEQAMRVDTRLQQELRQSHDPIQYIRNWNMRQQAQSELAAYGGDLNAYVAAKVQEAQTGAQPAPAANPAPADAPVIPQSIANTRPATTVANSTAQKTEQEAFEAIFD